MSIYVVSPFYLALLVSVRHAIIKKPDQTKSQDHLPEAALTRKFTLSPLTSSLMLNRKALSTPITLWCTSRVHLTSEASAHHPIHERLQKGKDRVQNHYALTPPPGLLLRTFPSGMHQCRSAAASKGGGFRSWLPSSGP